ncbi:MAG: EscU/YscU/HrcU family type III secretion system export apparatus switch protein [Chlamydiae bacterium]|nr:EscU/YscU/HrcU family type III secretion system export apparatus switch protein [Chlamydiota bacterium]
MAEKSEKATPKKIKDARKKGQVAKSQDFPAAFTFIVSIALALILSHLIYQHIADFMITMFRMISQDIDLADKGGTYFKMAIQVIFTTSFPIMMLTTLVGVFVNFIIIGPLFSMQALKPDIKRLNPVDNLKNLFKIKTFVELIKSILKITGALVLIYSVVKNSLPEIIATASMSVLGAALVFNDFLLKVIIRVGIFFLAIAIFDLVFQKRNFAKQMMMEKFEVKQEYKDSEGDPHIKGRRRQMAQEIAYQEGPSSVRRAKTVITNPVHIAVALEYEEALDPAPKILTMGKGLVADKIIQIAQEYHIPIMRNVPLAHELYDKGSISQYIPEDTYAAVAEILKWLAQLEEHEQLTEEKGYNPELFK